MNENPVQSRFSHRRERIRQRRALRGGGEWLGGAVLILLGIVLLTQNLEIAPVGNWWALFILLPAYGSFLTAWRMRQAAGGRFPMRARSAIIVGLVLTLVTALFFFDLNLPVLGPAILILAGVGIFINALFPD